MSVKFTKQGDTYESENAAEESTLRDILAEMESQNNSVKKQTSTIVKNQKDQTVHTKKVNQDLGSFGKAARKTEDTLEDLEDAADSAGSTLLETAKDTYQGFKSAVKGMVSSLSGDNIDMKGMVTNIGDAVGKGLSGISTAAGAAIGSFIPAAGTAAGAAIGSMVGSVLESTVVALTGAVAMAVGVMDGFAKTTQDLAATGVVFGEGIGAATEEILKQGLTMGMYSKVVQESGNELRILGGSASQGSKKLLKMYQALENNRNQFINLGYSIEEIPGLMADYTSSLEKFGVAADSLTPEQLKQGTLDYAKNLRTLADLTGEDVKSAKEKQKATMQEAQLQNLIIQLSNKGVKDAGLKVADAVKMLEQSGLSTAGAMEYLNRQVVTGADAYYFSQNKGAQDIAEATRDSLFNTDDAFGQEEYRKVVVQSFKDNAEELKKSIENDLAPIAAIGGDKIGAITGMIGKVYEVATQYENLDVQKFFDNADKAATTQDKLAEGIASLEQSKVDMARAVQDLATDLTKHSAPIITGAISQLAGAITTSADAITALVDGLSRDPLEEQRTSLQTNTQLTGMATGQEIDTSLFDLNGQADLQIQLNEFIQRMRDKDESEGKIAEELAKLGVQIKDTSMFGISTFTKIQPTAAPTPGTPTQMPQASDAASSATDLPAHAFGDIVKPKQGGSIVKVAEAGQAEAILPTERTNTGQLGIKVTGEMIDSSTLMKNLLEVNKSQAALISGLNDKMANMTSSMDKLVNEQRQANRLAV